jgi:NAD(P)H-flavin reductase
VIRYLLAHHGRWNGDGHELEWRLFCGKLCAGSQLLVYHRCSSRLNIIASLRQLSSSEHKVRPLLPVLYHLEDRTVFLTTLIGARLRLCRSRATQYPTRPQNALVQGFATATAIYREAVCPELYFKNRWISWLSPPPLGRSLLISTYWVVIVFMLCSNAIINDAYYWERIGFRAAWVSVTQVPFVFLLAAKSSIIGVLSGSSYERLNWLHRWVSRTLLITVTVHGTFFYAEWVRSGNVGNQTFVMFELGMMPMVKYGMGAWFVLLWTFLSSLTPIRRLSYEIFVFQHLAAAAVFLWLLWVHVPPYAEYNIWFAISALVFDKIFLFCWTWWENVHLCPKRRTTGPQYKLIGHHADLRALDDVTTEVTIKDVSFSWRPGQHIFLRLPTLGPLESHPFTIANFCERAAGASCNEIQLVIQAQRGFTRRLHRKASSASNGRSIGSTAIISGPFGCPPAWNSFETLVLISASTGASFTLPILESILSKKCGSCASRIDVLTIVRRRCRIEVYLPRLNKAVSNAEDLGIELHVTVAITGESEANLAGINSRDKKSSAQSQAGCQCGAEEGDGIVISSPSSRPSSSPSSTGNGRKSPSHIGVREKEYRACCCGVSKERITYACGRPDLAEFIRRPVEASGGETSVAVCGGKSLVAQVRNYVASLSDERAVHKGTGAQGIHIHAEHYCF